MTDLTLVADAGQLLTDDAVRRAVVEQLSGQLRGQRVLVLVPDHTRTAPLPLLFSCLVETLHDAARLDVLVALGTHPPLSDDRLNALVGITAEERAGRYAHVGLFNHAWEDPDALTTLDVIGADEVRMLAGRHWHPSLPESVPVRINRAAVEADHIVIVGPTFPHEVIGFSGGAKYLFPGISGAEMIHATHWLGALASVVGTIGYADTPVRAMVHAAARRLKTPVTLIALTVEGERLTGLTIGDLYTAWSTAAQRSAERHIRWCDRPYRRVLSCAPPMYDELWTGAKAMYKLEPVVEKGGELVIYAPHLDTVSYVHGRHIEAVGYHILPYFLNDWDRFKHVPLGVLAHSTHLRGSGVMDGGVERANVNVILASRIPPDQCARLNLGYMDPATIDPAQWQGREDEGVLVVPKAGEILYRLRP